MPYKNPSDPKVKEKKKAYKDAYNALPEVKAKKQAYQLLPEVQVKRALSRTRQYLKNREKELADARLWASNNRDKKNAHKANRKAKKINAGGRGISPSEWKAIIDAANGICSYCDAWVEKLTLDHIVPLDRGGEHDILNAAAACRSCNSSKSTKLLYEEWIPPNKR